jgi:hypothetical protein
MTGEGVQEFRSCRRKRPLAGLNRPGMNFLEVKAKRLTNLGLGTSLDAPGSNVEG